MVFVIHWHESAMDIHVFPIPIPPPTSLSTRYFWVFPVHQVQALVSCIQPGLVICKTDFSKLQALLLSAVRGKITISLIVFGKLMKKTLQGKKKSMFKWWLAYIHSSPKLAIMASLSYLVHTINFQYISFYIQSTFHNLQTVCLYKLAFVILLPNVSIRELFG